jgi:hypothetical protein
MHAALALEVELRPPALAIVRDPFTAASGSRVEIRWQWTSGVRPLGGNTPSLEIQEFRIVFGDPGWGADPDLDLYRTALSMRFAGGEMPKSFAPRPHRGQPIQTDFYKQLLAAYDQLVAEKHPAPAVELARIYKAEHATVKTWLRRGRNYLKNEREA